MEDYYIRKNYTTDRQEEYNEYRKIIIEYGEITYTDGSKCLLRYEEGNSNTGDNENIIIREV